ncbi:hypothetical protein [Micromonospora sp. NPDC005206]|uniref:hypothetical protein n=1 Tax=Micromonospora sp. NPDC005206 TaxID=3157022 RepID=UPI0033B22B3F
MLVAAAEQEGLGVVGAGGDAADDRFGGAVGADFLPSSSAGLVASVEAFDHDALDARGGAREKVWLGEVAALEESLTHLRRRRAEADSQLTRPDALDNITG